MDLTETQRRAYLDAMGIRSYFPRYILPGAKPSRRFEWPQQVTVDPPLRGLEKGAAGSVVARVPEQRQVPEATARPMIPPPVIRKEHGADTPVDGIRFKLVFIHAGSDLCIVNQLPYLGRAQFSSGHMALLVNILKSLGMNVELLQVDENPFQWPFHETGQVGGLEAASQALVAFLQQKMAVDSFSRVWVMGEMLAPVFPGEREEVAGGGLTVSGNLPWQVLITRSLDEIHRFPGLKRDVWRQVQILLSHTDG